MVVGGSDDATRPILSDLVERAKAELRAYEKEPYRRRLAGRNLARLFVEMRSRCTVDGRPDWSGRSAEYRNAAREVWSSSNLDKVEKERFHAVVRFHSSQALHEVATVEELEDAGIKATPLIERHRDWRTQRNGRLAARRGVAADQPNLVFAVEAMLDQVDSSLLVDLADEMHVEVSEALERVLKATRKLLREIKR